MMDQEYIFGNNGAVVFGMISSIPYINTDVMYVLNKCIRVSGSRNFDTMRESNGIDQQNSEVKLVN
jgi:hypothetical protein